jgi:hypothetical protein
LEPAEAGFCLDLPKVLEIRMGVSYFTSEKLLDALVVIFLFDKIKLLIIPFLFKIQ